MQNLYFSFSPYLVRYTPNKELELMYFCLKSDMCINRKKVYITFKTYFEI